MLFVSLFVSFLSGSGRCKDHDDTPSTVLFLVLVSHVFFDDLPEHVVFLHNTSLGQMCLGSPTIPFRNVAHFNSSEVQSSAF